MLVFFAMFGAIFIITQYFQFVLGYSPLETGVRFLPWAALMMIVSPLSARLVHRVGTKLIVGSGLGCVAVALVLLSQLDASSSYWPDVCLRMMLMAAGMGLTMAPATESIMGALPHAKAGVGSAVNDTTARSAARSVSRSWAACSSSTYSNQIAEFLRGKNVPTGLAHTIEHSPLGFALRAGNEIRVSTSWRPTPSSTACTPGSSSPRAPRCSAR